MNGIISDLQFAARTLRKSSGFTLVAIVTLALGVGANTAIFSLVDSVLLRMLPVSHPEELKLVNTNAIKVGAAQISLSMSVGTLKAMRDRAHTVLGLCASQDIDRLNVGVDGQAQVATGQFVTGNYYTVLGVPPLIGRGRADRRATARIVDRAFRNGDSPSRSYLCRPCARKYSASSAGRSV